MDTTVITMFDVDERGMDDVMDIALEVAWKNADAVYLSFDIDVFDPSCAPGTGTPDAGGLSSREGLQAARRAAREGLIGMDLVEIAPPYDNNDITALLGARVIMDVLATLVEHGHLGRRLTGAQRAEAERARERAAGIDGRYLPMLGDRHQPR
jgi:agmatinase